MNTIKKINLSLVLLAALFFLTGSFSAQQRQRQGPPPMPDDTQINKMVADLSNELSLSKAQKTEVLSIYHDHFSEVKSLMSNGKKPNREEMDKLKTDFEEKVRVKLNEEQAFKFEKYIKSQNKKPNKNRMRK